jgi:hypothetical protein
MLTLSRVVCTARNVERLYDWQCEDCGSVSERLVTVPHGEAPARSYELECLACADYTDHTRLISPPARYMGEKVHNPMISGGRFDTTGHRPLPAYPDMAGEAEYNTRLQARLAEAPASERRAVMREMGNSAPSLYDYHEHMSKPEVREIAKERKRIASENKQKQKRLAALKRGESVNFKRDRVAGDPKLN